MVQITCGGVKLIYWTTLPLLVKWCSHASIFHIRVQCQLLHITERTVNIKVWQQESQIAKIDKANLCHREMHFDKFQYIKLKRVQCNTAGLCLYYKVHAKRPHSIVKSLMTTDRWMIDYWLLRELNFSYMHDNNKFIKNKFNKSKYISRADFGWKFKFP